MATGWNGSGSRQLTDYTGNRGKATGGRSSGAGCIDSDVVLLGKSAHERPATGGEQGLRAEKGLQARLPVRARLDAYRLQPAFLLDRSIG